KAKATDGNESERMLHSGTNDMNGVNTDHASRAKPQFSGVENYHFRMLIAPRGLEEYHDNHGDLDDLDEKEIAQENIQRFITTLSNLKCTITWAVWGELFYRLYILKSSTKHQNSIRFNNQATQHGACPRDDKGYQHPLKALHARLGRSKFYNIQPPLLIIIYTQAHKQLNKYE
ncbi:hypothetical protein M8C21_008731, partial [Ambrosia artemisiifolia]